MKIKGFIITGVLLGIIGAGCCITALAANDFDIHGLIISEKYNKLNESYSAKNDLVVDCDIADVTITAGTTENFEIEYTIKKHSEVVITENENSLEFSQAISWKNNLLVSLLDNLITRQSLYVNIALPIDFFGSLTIKSNVGDIKIDDIDATALVSSTDTGDILITDFTAETISADSNIGEINLTNVQAEEAIIEDNTGDIQIRNSQLQIITASSNIGNIRTVSLSGQEADFQTDFGDIDLQESELTKVKSYTNVGSISFQQLSSENLNLTTELGDIAGTISGNEADYAITIIEHGHTTERQTTQEFKLYAKTNIGNIYIDWLNNN